jgi:hypothetical protein
MPIWEQKGIKEKVFFLIVQLAVDQIRNFHYLNCRVGRQMYSDVNINRSGCEGEIYLCMETTSKGYE